MTGRGIFFVSLLVGAAPAHAWEVVAQVSLRLSVEVTSRVTVEASSNASTAASNRDAAKSASPAGENETAQAEPPPKPRPPACSSHETCQPGQSCVDGRCETIPEPVQGTEPPMLLRRGSELYLRGHASQLRQDVALGEGPVIATLSALERVPPRTLGRLMRSHHRELLELIGDGADDGWPERFLHRLSDLSRPAVTRVQASPRSRGS